MRRLCRRPSLGSLWGVALGDLQPGAGGSLPGARLPWTGVQACGTGQLETDLPLTPPLTRSPRHGACLASLVSFMLALVCPPWALAPGKP